MELKAILINNDTFSFDEKKNNEKNKKRQREIAPLSAMLSLLNEDENNCQEDLLSALEQPTLAQVRRG